MSNKNDNLVQELILRNSKLIIFMIMVLFSSCNKDQIGPQGNDQENSEIILPDSHGFFVVNEGNFTSGNGSLSYIDLDEPTVYNNYYENVNDELLGDVFQSMNKIDDKYFLVINNSQKIVVADSLFNTVTTISGFTSPRFICQVTPSKAYVTDLFANQISIVDLNSFEITGAIPVGGWTEELMMIGNKVWVQDYTNSKLLIIDPSTDQIENEIQLSTGISNMVLTNDSSLWVMCDGGYLDPILPQLHHINTTDFTTIDSFGFDENEVQPRFLTYNSNEDVLYFYQDGIRKMNVLDAELPYEVFIQTEIDQVYGLDFYSPSQYISITDARLGAQGELLVFSTQGSLVNSFDVGRFPNGIFTEN